MKENQSINLLRFAAALLVCMFHFNESSIHIDNWYRNFVKIGWVGVPIFFVVSGFCIELTARKSQPFAFLIRRLFRIYPMYWMSLIVILGIALFQKLYTGTNSVQGIPQNISDVFATLILYITPVNHIHSMNWVYWSLVCEIHFYIIFFIGLIAFKKHLPYFFIAISTLSLLFPVTENEIWYYFLKDWPSFALGISLFYIFDKTSNKKLAVALLCISLIAVVQQNGLSQNQWIYFAGIIFSCIIIISSHYKDLPYNLFSDLGKYAYGVYLLHVPLVVFFFGTIFKVEKENVATNILLDCVGYFAVLGIAFLSYKFVELPFIDLGKKLITKWNLNKKHINSL